MQTSIEETLSRVFGHGTIEFDRYSSAAHLDNGPVIMGGGPNMPWEVQEWLVEGKKRSIAVLTQAVTRLAQNLSW